MFGPDILHDFEAGTWKATFTHLVRILYAHAEATGEHPVQVMNER